MSTYAGLDTRQLNFRFIELCIRRAVTKDQKQSAAMLQDLHEMDAELTRRETIGAPTHVA